MTTGKQKHLDSAENLKTELLAILDGMGYCLDWKQEPTEWSARELVYHILETPPGGVHGLVKGILAGEVSEYDLWSDLTNMTPERAGYDLAQVTADIEALFQGLQDALSGASDSDLDGKTVMMHQKTRGVDEERSVNTILERTLNVHIPEHLVQVRGLREALGI
ncbi:MAG: hypothetical protein O3A93_13750 [Chloroflexi bacterium]|nr:hypothetical protein [Chloroflexota bacterium]MDA1272294.1 hypothetical protein [Chloroflexota bacterium]PKB59155.1 MAG: hypothetical protein BZY83_03290 [SAR202 cluster bacterium Casp-Chloro-G2]